MGFHNVIEINEAHQLTLAMCLILEDLLLMPHLHKGTDHPGKRLADTVLAASQHQGMLYRAFVLLAVIGVGILDLIGALSHHGLGEKAYR